MYNIMYYDNEISVGTYHNYLNKQFILIQLLFW